MFAAVIEEAERVPSPGYGHLGRYDQPGNRPAGVRGLRSTADARPGGAGSAGQAPHELQAAEVALHFPLRVILEILGVPRED